MHPFARYFWAALAVLALAVSGCGTPVGPGPATVPTLTMVASANSPTAAEATAEMVTPTSPGLPTDTPAPAASPTAPSTVTAAPTPTGAVINAQNAKDLVEVTLTLPGPMGHIAWLGSDVTTIPSALSPRPQLILLSGEYILPLFVGDSLIIGKQVPLTVDFSQILALAPDSSSLVVQDPSKIRAFRLDGRQIRDLEGLPSGAIYKPLYEATGQYLAATTPDKIQAFVYNMRDTSVVQLEGFETAAPVYTARVSPGGRWLAWVSRATMQFQDVNAPRSTPGAKLSFTDFIGPWAFSRPDGSKMALYVSNKLSVYSVPDAQELISVTTGQPVNSLAWSPDGTLLAGGYGDSLQVWDSATLAPLASLRGPNAFTGEVSFSPDGRYIYSIHDNEVIGVWKVK